MIHGVEEALITEILVNIGPVNSIVIGLSILWVASLLFGFFFLRKTGRTIYADYDMTTVCAMDAKYQKLFKWYIYASAM